jgi:hypothetical protein
LGDALRLPKRHPAWRRREAQSGSRKKLPSAAGPPLAGSRPFHALRVGNAGGRLVRNVRTWPAMLREKMLSGGGENLVFIGADLNRWSTPCKS